MANSLLELLPPVLCLLLGSFLFGRWSMRNHRQGMVDYLAKVVDLLRSERDELRAYVNREQNRADWWKRDEEQEPPW